MKQMMAILSTGILTSALFGCTQAGPQRTVATHGYPYTFGTELPAPNPAYRKWTTAQLQQRRIDLYYMVPQSQSRHGIAAYTYRGMPLPQEDEIKANAAELSRLYYGGEKANELQRVYHE